MSRVVLVTGVSRHLGSRMARILSHDPAIDRVVGVDVIPPRSDIGGAEFVRADIRNPIIGKVIAAAGVDTVVHMGVISTPVQAGGRVSMKEIEENGYNLNITRYISTQEAEDQIDLRAVNAELVGVTQKIEEARERHNAFLRELGLPPV